VTNASKREEKTNPDCQTERDADSRERGNDVDDPVSDDPARPKGSEKSSDQYPERNLKEKS